MNYKETYQEWLSNPYFDEDTKKELTAIENDENEIKERFYADLAFGTAGLRGIIGAGINRMNIYVVRKATQGLADYILEQGTDKKRVAIAFDSRHMSPEFADEAARTLAANGIKAFIFESLRPTPELSFAVRHLDCIAGINVTASHNPPQYNGYKVYWEDGAQFTDPHASGVTAKVNAITDISTCKTMSKEDAVTAGLYEVIGKEVDDAYIAEVEKQVINQASIDEMASKLKIVYTPLHGTGNLPVRRVLDDLGFKNVYVVPEQELPDSEFTTVGYPNPENPAVFELAIKLAEKIDADIILGTDPDCDRVGAVVKTKDGSYTVLTGNMTGTLICNYICSQKAKLGTLPKNGALVSTIVSSEMTKAIAKKYNLAYFDVLTGFKYIGEKIKEFEQTGDYQYVFGFEESYGCLSGTYARDKDAVVASLLICEMAAYYKSRGMSLYDGLMELYDTYGVYKEIIHSITLKGIEGIENMKKIMDTLRKDAPSEIAGVKVTETRDYLEDKIVDVATGKVSPTNLPKSNVLYFTLADDTWFCVRPSGTEPKIKIYFGTKADTVENAEKKIATAQDGIMKVVNSVLGE